MKSLLFALGLLLAPPAYAAPGDVATFHSIGLYWAPPGGAAGNPARVEFRVAGDPAWREGLALWFDTRNGQYRGSLVELAPATSYIVRLTLDSGFSETLRATTWSEEFRIKRSVRVRPATTHLVIDASDSGSEREGYVLFTALRVATSSTRQRRRRRAARQLRRGEARHASRHRARPGAPWRAGAGARVAAGAPLRA